MKLFSNALYRQIRKAGSIVLLLSICLLFAACGKAESGQPGSAAGPSGNTIPSAAEDKEGAALSSTAHDPAASSPSADSADSGTGSNTANTLSSAAASDSKAAQGKAVSEAGKVSGSDKGQAGTDAASKADKEKDRTIDFSLGFAGDICFADDYIPMQHLAWIGSEDISDGIDPAYIKLMRGMDIMWINNEFAYTDRGRPLDGKAFVFGSSPSHVSYLHDLGVDIVGLANNHTFDMGPDGFEDTLATLERAGIPFVGAGRNLEEAMEPVILEADGFKIAYVAASCAEYTIYTPEATETEPGILWCYDDAHFLESIRRADKAADYVIALPHWGEEHSTWLTDKQLTSAKAYIDAGADIVIGAHPHILQGMEFYKGKPILYSLGNFWFDDYDIDTMVAELHFHAKKESGKELSLGDITPEIILHPGTQSGVYTALADTEEWRERIYSLLESISINAEIDEDGVVHEYDSQTGY